MRVEDLGSGPPVQGATTDTSLAATNPKKIRFFNFINLLQVDSQKIRLISSFASIFSILQNIFISVWPHLKLRQRKIIEKYDFIRTPPIYEEYLTNVFFLYSITNGNKLLYIYSLVINIISYIFFFISLVCFLIYYFHSVINFQLVLCFNFFISFICRIVIVPLGFQTSWIIMKLIQLNDLDKIEADQKQTMQIYIALIVFNSVLFIIVILMTILTNFFNSNSITIVDTQIVLFDGKFKSCLTVIPAVILFLSNLLPLFHPNLLHLSAVFHIIFCICMTIRSFWLPYGKVRVNSVVSSICMTMLVSDFLSFTDLNTKWYRYPIIIGCFIVFNFIMNFFIKLRIRSILKVTKDDEKGSEDDPLDTDRHRSTPRSQHNSPKFQFFGDQTDEFSNFENLSVSQILFILRTAMMTRNKLFLDGKFLDLIGSKVSDDQDKIQLACLICYFPDFQPFFFAILMGLKRVRYLPLIREFQLFQLRCFDAGCHPDSKIEDINDIINESTSLSVYLRSYWQIIESSQKSLQESEESSSGSDEDSNKKTKVKANIFAAFDRLSRSIFNCQSKWKAAICLYPNNILIAEEYTKFLIECCGDYTAAAEWKMVSVLLQEGKTYKFNSATISFLRSYPHYVNQVFPKRTLMKGLDDIDNHNKIENIEKLVEMSEARIEFQRSTNSSYPISMYVFVILSIISFVFILIFWIHGICTFKHFEHMTESMYFISNVGLLSQQISKNFINAIFDYGQLPSVGVVPTSDEIFKVLYDNSYNDRLDTRDAPSLIKFNGEYKTQLARSSEQGMGLIDYLHNSTLRQIEKGNKFQVVLNTFYDNTRLSTYYLSKNESITSTSNLQSLIVSYFTYYFMMSSDTNFSYINDTDCYHATMAGAQVLERIDLISQSILQNNDIILDDWDFTYSTELYIVGSAYLIISVIIVWVDVFFIIRNFASIINSLSYFPKSAIEKASRTLIIQFDESPELNAQTSIKNFVVISLVVATIINILIAGLIFYFHFIYAKYKDNFKALSELIHFYSLETSQVVEVLYYVMAANTFGRIIPSVDKKYKDRLSSSLAKIVKTHQRCWSYSIRGDCGVNEKRVLEINNLKNKEKCPNWPNKTYHELYGCLSEESGFNLFIDLSTSLQSSIKDENLLKSDTFIQYLHFSLSHLYYDVIQFASFLQDAANEKENEYIEKIQILAAVSIVVACFLAFLNVYIFMKIRGIFNLLFAFISRVLPSDLVLNNKLMSALLGIKNQNKGVIENSGTSFLVQESTMPIIFIDRSGLIEFINRAFTTTFIYEANFIVGQPISVLIKNESALYYIETLKFFDVKKIASKTIQCKKGNDQMALFDVTFIPIHNPSKEKLKLLKECKESECGDEDDAKNSFMNRIALVFTEKTSEKNLEKKCNHMRLYTQKVMNEVFPPLFNLYNDGQLKICAICLIKLPSTFNRDTATDRLLAQRQGIYKLLYEKLQIFPLLEPLVAKNGLFIAVGCKKNDPIELAIECLNFAFNIIDELNSLSIKRTSVFSLGMKFTGTFFAAVETGGEIQLNWSGENSMRTMITGELIDRATRVLDNASLAGTVCVSKKTYEYIIMHDYSFIEKEIPEEICGCNYIYSVETGYNGSARYSSKSYDNGSENKSISNNSSSFIDNLREDLMSPNDDQ